MELFLRPAFVLISLLLVFGCGVSSTDRCEVTVDVDSCELTRDQVAACRLILEDVTPLETSRDHTSPPASSIYLQVGDCDQPGTLLEAMDMPGYEFLPAASYSPGLGRFIRFETFECLSSSELKIERSTDFMGDTWVLELKDGSWSIKTHDVRWLI